MVDYVSKILLLLQIWEKEEVPSDLNDPNIVIIFKKGDRRICRNYHGISLLTPQGKSSPGYFSVAFSLKVNVASELTEEPSIQFCP